MERIEFHTGPDGVVRYVADGGEAKRLNFEEVRCPLRGICKDEGVVCKPTDALPLTRAEREVAGMYAYGYTFKEIAAEQGKSPATVKAQLHGMKAKLGVRNCRALIKVLRSRAL